MNQTKFVQLDVRLKRTRKALMESLLILLNGKSFEQISIREITSGANVSYATFYRHYASKEDLLHELADAEVRRLIEAAMPAVFIDSMRESCRIVCARVEAQKGLWRAMLTGGAAGVLREEFVREIQKLKGKYTGMFSAWLPEELHLICATGATLDVLRWWLQQEPMPPADEVVAILDRLIEVLSTREL